MKPTKIFGAMTLTALACTYGPAFAKEQPDSSDCATRVSDLQATLQSRESISETGKTALRSTIDQAGVLCTSGNRMLADQFISALESQVSPELETESADAALAKPAESHEEYALGEPRDDLERFYGLYALPDEPQRKLFVAPADSGNPDRPIPDGFLMVGAMWGDASNWYMKSMSDTDFEQQWVSAGGPPVTVNFIPGDDGTAHAMRLQSRFMSYDRMKRTGDLPDDW